MKTTTQQIMNSNRYKNLWRNIKSSNQNQRLNLLNNLLENFWKEVPLTDIAFYKEDMINSKWTIYSVKRWISQYNARISELRDLWFVIENRIEHIENPVYWYTDKLSFYKLIWMNEKIWR